MSVKRVLVPAEHGGWGFLFEPIALGLVVAPSFAGLCIALAGVCGFLARQPMKLAFQDRAKGKVYPRTILATRAFAALAVLAAAFLAAGVLLGKYSAVLVLGSAAPLAALALALDLSRQGRSFTAEVAAPLALAALAPAIAAAGGEPRAVGLALWIVLALRAVTSIPFVRARLRLAREGRAALAGPVLAQFAGLAVAVALGARGYLPWLAVAAVALLAARALLGLSPWRPVVTARQVGFGEIAFGAITVALTAWGIRAGW